MHTYTNKKSAIAVKLEIQLKLQYWVLLEDIQTLGRRYDCKMMLMTIIITTLKMMTTTMRTFLQRVTER